MSLETEPLSPAAASRPSTEPKLIPGLSSRWALRRAHVALVSLFCVLFLLLNHLPLRNTDLWGHVVFGRYILDHGTIPIADPLLPLSEGVRVFDPHWLAQTLFAATERSFGAEGLTALFTLVVGLTYVVLARTFFLQTKSLELTMALVVAVIGVGWSRVTTIRPENFAMLLFATLLWLQIGRRVRGEAGTLRENFRGDVVMWIAVPMIAGLWANLHGSFPIVIATLGCFWLGRAIEVAWATRDPQAVLADREMRRQLYWMELAFAATLVNPYGMDAWVEAIRFSSNLNLREVLEWSPLVIVGTGGREFALACLALAVVLRHSRKPMNPADVLLLLLFGLAAVMQIRMCGWFAVVWGVALAPHLADVVAQYWPGFNRPRFADAPSIEEELDTADVRTPMLRYRYTLVCGIMIWVTFSFTSLSRPLLGGTARTPDRLFSENTPVRAAEFLRNSKLTGLAFNPQPWGDWLEQNPPPGMTFFTNTNIHLLPRTVWVDYLRISRGDSGWDSTLDKYNVRVLVLDKQDQANLLRQLKVSPDWLRVYEDDQAMILRRKPTSAAAAPVAKNDCGTGKH
jgi:uncharacterized membrane protein (GlpM family)